MIDELRFDENEVFAITFDEFECLEKDTLDEKGDEPSSRRPCRHLIQRGM